MSKSWKSYQFSYQNAYEKKYAREKNNIDFLIDFDSDNHFI